MFTTQRSKSAGGDLLISLRVTATPASSLPWMQPTTRTFRELPVSPSR